MTGMTLCGVYWSTLVQHLECIGYRLTGCNMIMNQYFNSFGFPPGAAFISSSEQVSFQSYSVALWQDTHCGVETAFRRWATPSGPEPKQRYSMSTGGETEQTSCGEFEKITRRCHMAGRRADEIREYQMCSPRPTDPVFARCFASSRRLGLRLEQCRSKSELMCNVATRFLTRAAHNFLFGLRAKVPSFYDAAGWYEREMEMHSHSLNTWVGKDKHWPTNKEKKETCNKHSDTVT